MLRKHRDQCRYARSLWETSLQCNDVSQWLGAYIYWSLKMTYQVCKWRQYWWIYRWSWDPLYNPSSSQPHERRDALCGPRLYHLNLYHSIFDRRCSLAFHFRFHFHKSCPGCPREVRCAACQSHVRQRYLSRFRSLLHAVSDPSVRWTW